MNIEVLCSMYDKLELEYGVYAYRHISALLQRVKSKHKRNFTGSDHEQSWRAWKGKNLEKLVAHIIRRSIEDLGISMVNGGKLERTKTENLSEELNKVKRNLLIDYCKYGAHLPDIDIVLYRSSDSHVVALLSIKVTLRERIAQTGYWKLKLDADSHTNHVKLYFITLDEDGTLKNASPAKKGRAIVETDTDGSYVFYDEGLQKSEKVKGFSDFLDDLRKLIKTT